jgi:hypothetical protein
MNMAVGHGHGWTDASKQIPFYYTHTLHNWLVVLTILKNMNVNGKDDIPHIMEHKKCLKPPTR